MAFPQPPHSHRRRRRRTKDARLIGVVFLFLGGFLLYACEIMPVLEAQHHMPVLTGGISGKGTALGFVSFVFGLALAIGGAPVMRLVNPPPEKSKIPIVVATSLTMVAGFALYLWTKVYLESLGYSFRF